MNIKLKGGGYLVYRAAGLSDYPSLSITHVKLPTQVSGGTTTRITTNDAVVDRYVGSTFYNGGFVRVEGSITKWNVENLNPDVVSIGEDGLITRVSEGEALLMLKVSGVSIPLNLDLMNKVTGQQPDVYVSATAGSLAEHCQTMIDGRINSSMTMASNGKFFTTQSPYVRNTNLWCSDVDRTCISPWNSNSGNKKAGTLVTPRHVLGASHYEYGVGTVVRFVTNDNVVVDRTVIGKQRHPNYTLYSPDLTIYTLDSDLPATIKHCKVMPLDYFGYLRNNEITRPPALALDQEEKALIKDYQYGGRVVTPVDSDRLIFTESIVGGDSGNPAFLIVNDELVLFTVWTYGGAGSGTSVADYISDINDMIVTSDAQSGANTGYTVTEADFSAFPNYA